MAQTGIRMSRMSVTFSDGSFFLSVRFFFPCRVSERLMAAGQRERSSGSLHRSCKVGSS